MKEFRFWIEIRGGYYIDVEANNLDEAIDIAMDKADSTEVEVWDYDVEEV